MNLTLTAAFVLLAATAVAQPAPAAGGGTGGAAQSQVMSPVEPPVSRAYEQTLYTPASIMVAPAKAQQVMEAFRAAYEKLGRPSLLLYVNRALVDESSGLRLVSRTEHTEGAQAGITPALAAAPSTAVGAVPVAPAATTRVTAENTYVGTPKPAATLAERQMVRDIERLFGRPLRAGGARIADQSAATELMADQPLDHFTTATNDAARKDRAALARVADVVIEVLVSSRTLTVPGIAGDQIVTVPDIQATAIRLKDSVIIGQAGSGDVLGKHGPAGRPLEVNDLAEATALALMSDIALTGGN
jgi:hypothetical protein